MADEAQGEQARDRSEERRLTCRPKPSAAIKSQSDVINGHQSSSSRNQSSSSRNQSSSSRNRTHPRPSAPRWPHGPQLRSRLSAVAWSEDPVGDMTRDVISGNQRSSVAIRGHQWPSEVISGNQRSSVAIIGHQVAIRGHQVAIRGHEAIGPRLWGIRRRSKVHQLQRAARGPRGARYGARARARRTVSELLLAQHGAERAEPFHRREGRIGARGVRDKIPDEGRNQRSSTGPSDTIKTPSRRNQDAIKTPSRRNQGAIKAQSRRNQGAIKAQSRRNQGAIKGQRVLGEGGEGH